MVSAVSAYAGFPYLCITRSLTFKITFMIVVVGHVLITNLECGNYMHDMQDIYPGYGI